jgi:hypothetical protein
LSGEQTTAIWPCEDAIQLHDGPLEVDVAFSPKGLEGFGLWWKRHVEIEGLPVFHPDEIIAVKEVMDREKDRESLPRLRAFRDCWIVEQRERTKHL